MNWITLAIAGAALLFSGGIFLIALLSFILARIDKILEAKIDPIDKKLNDHIADTDKKIGKLFKGQDRLESKLDQLLEDKNSR